VDSAHPSDSDQPRATVLVPRSLLHSCLLFPVRVVGWDSRLLRRGRNPSLVVFVCLDSHSRSGGCGSDVKRVLRYCGVILVQYLVFELICPSALLSLLFRLMD
jgi:hypothetical protein